jgi:hypothetical protein
MQVIRLTLDIDIKVEKTNKLLLISRYPYETTLFKLCTLQGVDLYNGDRCRCIVPANNPHILFLPSSITHIALIAGLSYNYLRAW